MDTNKVVEQVDETTGQVGRQAKAWAQRAKGTARDAGAAADLYVHEYAWTTVALVAIAACTLGMLLARRS